MAQRQTYRPSAGGAYAIRYTGEDIGYYEPATNEWLYNPALQKGEVLDGEMYPVVYGA